MKVKEMIDILSKYPEDSKIMVVDDNEEYLDPYVSVSKGKININNDDIFYFEDDFDEIEEQDISNYDDIVIIY